MKTIKKVIAKKKFRYIDPLCGGTVVLFEPPNPRFAAYLRCCKCHRPVPDYERKRVAINLHHRRNGQAEAKKH